MRRILFILVLIGLPLAALGLSWDAAFEATPANTDPLSEGDNRIRELKDEVRNRGEVELCWGTADGSGCGAADDGRLREGSARIFIDTAEPTTISGTDLTATTTLDAGRCWLDTDGPDNTGATEDDNTLYCWDTSFKNISIGSHAVDSLSDVTITTVAANQILQSDGTDWLNVDGTVTDIDTVSLSTPTALAVTTPTAISLGGNPSVTVPAAGRYNVEVFVQGSVCADNNNRVWGMDLVSDPSGTPAVVYSATGVLSSNIASDNFSMHHFIEGATNGSTYTFGLQGAANTASDVFTPAANSVCSTIVDSLTGGTPSVSITVKLVPVVGVP